MRWWQPVVLLALGALLLSGDDDEDTVSPDDEPSPDPDTAPIPIGEKNRDYPGARGSRTDPALWVQLETSDAAIIRNKRRAWLTPTAARSFLDGARRFNARATELGLGNLRVQLNDASKQGGGQLAGHASHRRGVDLDVVVKGIEGQRLPPVALPSLLQAFLSDPNLQVIFLDHGRQAEVFDALEVNPELAPGLARDLQYPLPPHKGKTRVRHWPGHANHLHLRYRT